MGFDFSGHVLRAPRVAPGNSQSTNEVQNGVVRVVEEVPQGTPIVVAPGSPPQGAIDGYDLVAPPLVDVRADQYRAAILDAPGTTPVEYCIWAQNASNLALTGSSSWTTSEGEGKITTNGSLSVLNTETGEQVAGSATIVVSDNGFRTIGSIAAVVVARGDTEYDDGGWVDADDFTQGRAGSTPYEVILPGAGDQNVLAGIVSLVDANLTLNAGTGVYEQGGGGAQVLVGLDGGLSVLRGDTIVEVHYSLASSRFWWTRNDRYQKRFGWNDKVQRWEPYKGGAVSSLGLLKFDETYTLTPRPKGLVVGSALPGDGATADAYCMIRVGSAPGAVTSLPVGTGTLGGFDDGVIVLSDRDVDIYDFTATPKYAAVVGQTSGVLKFNPAFTEQHAGKQVWYAARDFATDADGVVGDIRGSDKDPLYISPIPAPTDFPLISLGSRSYQFPVVVDTEAELPDGNSIPSGVIYVAASTGRVVLSQEDIAKTDPNSPSFDKHYLGEVLLYSGVSLSGFPQTVKAPVALTQVTANGLTKYFVPDAEALVSDFVTPNLTRGLGISGILNRPDGTGVVPTNPAADVPIRPGGDNLGDVNDGRVREVSDGISDTIVFTRKKALSVVVVDKETDIPSVSRIPDGTCYVTRENVTYDGSPRGSRVVWGRNDAKVFGTDTVYFLQADFLPSVMTQKARIFSKTRFVFRFPEQVALYFAIDGVGMTWLSTNLNDTSKAYTPEEVAADINAFIGANPGRAYALSGSVVIEAEDPDTGTVEIGWGGATKDLSGSALLGFLPGWRVRGGSVNWLPDSGISFGMYRSPVNPDRTKESPDFKAVHRLNDETLTESIPAVPFQFFDAPPLQDIAGYADGVFFNIKTLVDGPDGAVFVDKNLEHYKDIVHRFGENKFVWVAADSNTAKVEKAVSTLGFGISGIVPESLLGAPGIGGGLYVSEDGGGFEFQDPDRDILLPGDGDQGIAVLIRRFGDLVTFGGRGSLTAGSDIFTDPNASFTDASDEQAQDSFGNLLFDTEGDPVFLPVAQEGQRLKVGSDSYLVTEVISDTQLRISPTPLVSTERASTWELFQGFTSDVYDPGIVADQVYKQFSHLPEEPMKVRVLSKLGATPLNATAQAANRLRADMEKAISRERVISLRYGLAASTASNTASMVALQKVELGSIANNVLYVPTTTGDRFDNTRFQLLIGRDTYVPVKVASFSADPATVEYLETDGLLKFSSALLSNYGGSVVHYAETFLDPTELDTLVVEYDPETGDLNLSAADMAAAAGETAWFVEQMITEEELDVSISPLAGSAGFQEPIKAFQAVEFEYDLADDEGRRVTSTPQTEFLPVIVRDEEATRVDDRIFTYNVTGREMDLRLEPTVRVGATIQNFGTIVDCAILPPRDGSGQGEIRFLNKTIPSHVKVYVTFASFEANGGERSYTASNRPLYRPPFFITADKDNFGLRTDRTGDFEVGQMLRIGESCHYIKALQYFATEDVTRVDIFPATVNEVGSRAPGNDVLTLVTAEPITTSVDPDGSAPVATTAPAGFMSAIDVSQFPFEPVEQGTKTITFLGDITQFAIPGHILEVAGMPFTIAQAELNSDGTRTKITTTGIFQKAVNVSSNPTVKLSYRPVYPPDVRSFLGVSPVIDSEPLELVLFGEKDSSGNELPGRTLVRDIEWSIDTGTGAVRLLEPVQKALGSGQKLLLSFTKQRTLQPFLSRGVVMYPRYASNFLFASTPSVDNGILSGTLTATFSYRNPDTFYCRALPMQSFLGEAAEQAIDEIKAKAPAGGAVSTAIAGEDNWDKGRTGIIAEGRGLRDQDRAARTFLDFYNSAVVAFEQINETISGGFVGDRDGKFRFFVGKGKDWPTPGYEDDITGLLTPRFIWSEVFNAANPFIDLLVNDGDIVTEPLATSLTNSVIDGPAPDADRFRRLMSGQKALVRNDVDDFVLLGTGRPTLRPKTSFPFFYFRGGVGDLDRMGGVHRFSRLFPTETKAFLVTYPGVGADENAADPGFYTFGRAVDGEFKKTFRSEIGQLSNPALGTIENAQQVSTYKRRARGRIWAYFPNGIGAGDFGTGIPAGPITDPCVVVFPTLLSEVPMNPATGYPDVAQLLSQGGTVPDAVSGDPELAVPGFQPGDQVNWGQPDGKTYPALRPVVETISPIPSINLDVYRKVVVRDIQHGCIIRFDDDAGNPISIPADLMVGTGATDGVRAHDWPIKKGDTLYVVPPTGGNTALTDPPDFAQLAELASRNDLYDIKFTPEGKILDITLPSFDDPTWFGLKEITGQNPPPPLSHLEADVQFVSAYQNPVELPALKGEFRDDSGDYQIPYMKSADTELDRFVQIQPTLASFFTSLLTDDYPDEIFGTDGEIVSYGSVGQDWDHEGGGPNPKKVGAVLMTTESMQPKTDTGAVGTADLRSYDLLLVEADDSEANVRSGSQGILQVGKVSSPAESGGGNAGFVKPARFITPTTPPPRWQVDLDAALVNNDSNQTGSPISYTFDKFFSYFNDPFNYPADPQAGPGFYHSGVKIVEVDADGDTNLDTTIIDFGDAIVAGTGIDIYLNDGLVDGTGNLNDLFDPTPGNPLFNNKIQIDLYALPDLNIDEVPGSLPGAGAPLAPGTPVYRIVIQSGQVSFTELHTNTTNVLPVALTSDVVFGTTQALFAAPAVPLRRQIVINGVGLAHFNNVGPNNQWFLPYVEANVGNPNYRREMIYGLDVSLSVDTYFAGGANAQSNTGWIDRDRLTFHEVFDLRSCGFRGAQHPANGATDVSGLLRIEQVTTPSGPSTINRINSGYLLTFMPKVGWTADGPFTEGAWAAKVAGVSPETSGVEVPAFEGDGTGNTPATSAVTITGSNIRFASMPTKVATIAAGTGHAESNDNGVLPVAVRYRYDNRVASPTNISVGTIGDIEKGDLLIIDRAADATDWASTKVGTYPVRYAIQPVVDRDGDLISDTLEVSPEERVGLGGSMFPTFPKVMGFDAVNDILYVDSIDGFTFAAAGKVFVVIDATKFGVAAIPLASFQKAMWSADYTGYDAATRSFTGLNNYRWADGTVITAPADLVLTSQNKFISGFDEIRIRVQGTAGLPEDPAGVVGWHETVLATKFLHGIGLLEFSAPGAATTIQKTASGGAPTIVEGAAPGAQEIGVVGSSPTPHIFEPDPLEPVYFNVATKLVWTGITSAEWDSVNNPTGHGGGGTTDCLIPNSLVKLANGATPGFAAQGGIFVEPSYPKPVLDYGETGAGNQRVIDSDHSLSASQVGFRNYDDYDVGGAPGTPENVHWLVRRPRRWHPSSSTVSSLTPLRYAYEIRRGRISAAVTTTDRGFQIITASGFTMNWNAANPPSATVALAANVWNDGQTYTGTNLGAFNDPDVNIHPGDIFRLLDTNGNVVEEAEIASVIGPGQLKLAVPGITSVTPAVGQRFEVYLRQAPVPHEQSMEQLLDLVTFKEVHRTNADYRAGFEQGGYAPQNTTGYDLAVNKFSDDHSVTGVTTANGGWSGKGVRRGDILIIDPTPLVPEANEEGAPPKGDRGVDGRVWYDAGATALLDDNRGFYRVTAINDTANPPQLTVNPVHSFAGDATTPVVFPGSSHPNQNDLNYAIYPTVSAPGWTLNAPSAGAEGQNDLRPTAKRSPSNSYAAGYAVDNDRWHSLRPVSYRIIRPNQMFSDEAIDFVLTVRERMLSWIDRINGIARERKLADYFVWMRDNHPHDLENLGLLTNAFVESFMGHWNVSPYMNSDDCLSILGRRFWIKDSMLDRMEPTTADPNTASRYEGQDTSINPPNVAFPGSGGPYTSYTSDIGGAVLPVLPDRVDEVLENSDRLRPIRYIWLAYRTHRLLGTLAAIERFEATLPERLEEQRQLALLQESTDKAEFE
jgi:hypothetical protein